MFYIVKAVKSLKVREKNQIFSLREFHDPISMAFLKPLFKGMNKLGFNCYI